MSITLETLAREIMALAVADAEQHITLNKETRESVRDMARDWTYSDPLRAATQLEQYLAR